MDKKQRRLRHKKQRLDLANVVSLKPAASLVANKYKVIAAVITRSYPVLIKALTQDQIFEMVDDAIALNREWQWETEGKDKQNKKRLEQEFFQGRMRGED